jgi:hypothetical protein
MKDLRQRLKNALARLYPGVGFDLNWIKESDHDWQDGGDDLIDRWHVVMRRNEDARMRRARREYVRRVHSFTPPTTGDDIPF